MKETHMSFHEIMQTSYTAFEMSKHLEGIDEPYQLAGILFSIIEVWADDHKLSKADRVDIVQYLLDKIKKFNDNGAIEE